ncbi:MAG TPA: hypothetical protein VF702_00250 [Allosphingosinicella sp.]|jgi:hypothetical protein
MRPQSIVLFERIVIASICLGLLSLLLTVAMLNDIVPLGGAGIGLMAVVSLVTFGIYGLLIYFIARKGSSTARWIYVGLAALGLLSGLLGIGMLSAFPAYIAILTLAQHALTIASLVMLFRPDAVAWFAQNQHGRAHGAMHGYGAPPHMPGHGAPPHMPGYGAPPAMPGQGAPPAGAWPQQQPPAPAWPSASPPAGSWPPQPAQHGAVPPGSPPAGSWPQQQHHGAVPPAAPSWPPQAPPAPPPPAWPPQPAAPAATASPQAPPPPPAQPAAQPAAAETRECPFCAEQIKAQAKKCRFCGSEVEPLPKG